MKESAAPRRRRRPSASRPPPARRRAGTGAGQANARRRRRRAGAPPSTARSVGDHRAVVGVDLLHVEARPLTRRAWPPAFRSGARGCQRLSTGSLAPPARGRCAEATSAEQGMRGQRAGDRRPAPASAAAPRQARAAGAGDGRLACATAGGCRRGRRLDRWRRPEIAIGQPGPPARRWRRRPRAEAASRRSRLPWPRLADLAEEARHRRRARLALERQRALERRAIARAPAWAGAAASCRRRAPGSPTCG